MIKSKIMIKNGGPTVIAAFICLVSLLVLISPDLRAHTQLSHAKNFSIEQREGFRLLTVRSSANADIEKQYALVSRGQVHTELPKDATIIHTPVKRVVAMETVYIGYLAALDQLDTLIAAGTTDFISNPTVKERIKNGSIQSVQVGQSLDIEKLLLLQPDLILTSVSGDPSFDVPPALARTGLPVLLTAGYLEPSPLARAEWIKCLGALFETEAKADTVFESVATHYQALTELAQTTETQPTVFCGAPYSGAWYVPAGKSYMAQAIYDAGADYLWSDVPQTGAIPLDTERVFLKAAQADYWINPSDHRSFAELEQADARFLKFNAAKTRNVFNNTKQVGPKGGNAIWEEGVVYPDRVLADLIRIFHPELLPEHSFVFYEPLK